MAFTSMSCRLLLSSALLVACGEDASIPPPAPQPEGYPTRRADETPADAHEAAATGAESPLESSGCVGPPGRIWVEGRVTDGSSGIADLRMGTQVGQDLRELTRTDADGRYQMVFDGPAWFTVLDVVSRPGVRCGTTATSGATEEGLEEIRIFDQDFSVGKVCPVRVRVLDPKGAPVAGAEVSLLAGLAVEVLGGVRPTDAAGATLIRHAPCEQVALRASSPRLLPTEKGASIPAGMESKCRFWTSALGPESVCAELRAADPPPLIELRTQEAVPIEGVVTDAEGQPVAGAEVYVLRSRVRTDAEGRYAIAIPKSDLVSVIHVEKDGFAEEKVTLRRWERGGDAGTPLVRDFTLEPLTQVAVRCLGLSPEICEDLRFSCEIAGGDDAISCGLSDYPICGCPSGAGTRVVRAGGAAVALGPDDDIAWLDFRSYQGGVKGVIVGSKRCSVRVRRAGAGPLTGEARHIGCADDGSFEIYRLPPGAWTVELRGPSDGDMGELSFAYRMLVADETREIEVADEVIDLGTLEL